MNLDQAMQLAITEALNGAPFVSPNPKVGCVILDSNGNLLSKGFHTRFGHPHAEVEALKNLNPAQLKDAHVIVTLEPCAHEGKTPSCAKTLAKLPINKVTYGLVDPNPLVAGQGAEILINAGIRAEEYQGPWKNELEETCEEFLWNFREKKIFVALKVAETLDGKISKHAENTQITGPDARQKVHELRAQYDAVLVGKKTVLVDNPSLNIRHPSIKKENKVIILDRSGDVLKNKDKLKLFQLHKPENIFVMKSDNLKEILKELYDKGIRSLMVEGGGQIFSKFLEEKLVQRLHQFTAPFELGAGISWKKSEIKLKAEKIQKLGIDTWKTGLIQY